MTRRHDDDRLCAEDAALVGRMREGFGPEPLDAVRIAAFDARLREARERPARRSWAWAALATATAAVLTWAMLPGEPSPVGPRHAPSEAALAWEQEVIFGEDLGDPLSVEDGDLLPPDYVALVSAFDL